MSLVYLMIVVIGTSCLCNNCREYYVHDIFFMQDIVKMHANPVLPLIMINVILTPSGLGGPPTSLYGWVDDMQV